MTLPGRWETTGRRRWTHPAADPSTARHLTHRCTKRPVNSPCVCVFGGGVTVLGGVTSVEGGADGVDAVAFGALTDRGVLEAETRRAALWVCRVQVEVAQFTPETGRSAQHNCFNPGKVRSLIRTHLSQLKPSTLSLQRH